MSEFGVPVFWIMSIPLTSLAVGVIAVIAIQIRKYVCYRHELEFKRDLVEQGLSIDEIERVVAAKSSADVK